MSRDRRSIDDEAFLICRSAATQFVVGAQTGRHRHEWGQLIYASAGVMTVWTERGSWVAPPQWAIWVPAAISHEIQFAGQTSLRTLYLRPDAAANLPPDCSVFSVSPLLRELILTAALLRH